MRYVILIASVLLQMGLGATYAWAVFVDPLRESTGLGQGLIQSPFFVFFVAFPLTAIFAGRWMHRIGPRPLAMTGGLIFGLGWVVAGFAEHWTGLLVIGIGGLGGIGVGLAYLAPITTGILWFPRHRGLVTGIAVTGFGGGAALIAQVADRLLETGRDPFVVIRMLGTAFGLLLPLAGAWLVYPGDHRPATNIDDTVRRAWRTRPFALLYLAMASGLAAGFVVNTNLKALGPLAAGRDGVHAVSIFALANALGRIAWGALFDRMRTGNILAMNLALQAVALLAAPALVQTRAGLWVLAGAVGLNFGGVLVLYAASTARQWGPAHMGAIYGLIFSANMPAALAPMIAGWGFDLTGSFVPALWGLSVGLLAMAWWLRRGASWKEP